jgi:hypothetical protein
MENFIAFERAVRMIAPSLGDDLIPVDWHVGIAKSRLNKAIAEGEIRTVDDGLGGQLLSEVKVREMIAAPYAASASRRTDMERPDAIWPISGALAWIATGNLELVIESSDPNGWCPPHEGDLSGPMNVFAKASRQRSLGWLTARVADGYCHCTGAPDKNQERWQVCACLGSSLMKLKDCIRAGDIEPVVTRAAETGTQLMAAELGAIRFAPGRFDIILPNTVDFLEFAAFELRRAFPAKTTEQAACAASDDEVKNEMVRRRDAGEGRDQAIGQMMLEERFKPWGWDGLRNFWGANGLRGRGRPRRIKSICN